MTDTTTTDTTTPMQDVIALANDDEAWTWLDDDPSVAWGDESSYHGRLAAIYEDAGWERCYHRDGARFHFNVKVNSNAQYRGYQDKAAAIETERGEGFDRNELDLIAQEQDDSERERWWSEISWAEDETLILRTRLSDGPHTSGPNVLGCGRSGGYVNIPDIESDGETMVRMAAWLTAEVREFNSREAGEWIAERALERYDEERVAELSTDRACPSCGTGLTGKVGA